MRKIIIGTIGPGEGARKSDRSVAYQLGKLIATKGWVVLTGGRKAGVMDAASAGAKSVGGLTVGILPDRDPANVSEAIDLAIFTDLGNARNNINVLSADVVVACGMGLGTTSEIALALKNGKKVILLNHSAQSQIFFQQLSKKNLTIAETPEMAIELIETILHERDRQ
jgi:hypothetical protein